MNQEFENKIKKWREVRLTEVEKAEMLNKILSTPVPSPYTRYMKALVFVRKPATFALVACLVLTSSLTYASQDALPGETLYAVKIRVVEPVIDALNTLPEHKLVWEEEKVQRRLAEAQALVIQDKLDEEIVREIEDRVEASSIKFRDAAEEVSKRIATTTEKQQEKAEELKQKFRERLEGRVAGQEEQGELTTATLMVEMKAEFRSADSSLNEDGDDKIRRIKNKALNALDKKEDND